MTNCIRLLVATLAPAVLVCLALTGPSQTKATLPGANGKIAFERKVGDASDIFVMNADGTGQTNLTNHPANDFDAAWSPSGKKIAFTSERDGNREIYVMNGDGSNPTRLTNDPAMDFRPAWSPDGATIAFRRGDQIWKMNADGTGQVNLSGDHGVDTGPDFSPDGQKIVFFSNEDGDFEIMVMNADGSNRMQLTDDPGFDGDPSWSPDGEKIAFTRSTTGRADIWVMNADGTNEVNITDTVVDTDSYPDWSPDGSKIALVINPTFAGDDIFVMDADGTNKQQLTYDHHSYNPDWQAGTIVDWDVDCSGAVDAVDALKVLRRVADLPTEPAQGCPEIGTGSPVWGDVDCSGMADSVDALKVLRHVAGLPVDLPDGCTPPGSTPTPSPTPQGQTPSPAPVSISIRNSQWHLDASDVLIAAGEVVNNSDRPIGLIRVEASLYSASGDLLKTGVGYSCLTTVPSGGDSPFEVMAFAPGPVDRVELNVTQFNDPPFVPAPEGLQGQVTNTYTDQIGYFHAAGNVTNNSSQGYKLVKACIAFYDAQGAVFRSKFSFTTPNVLNPGEAGSFDASIKTNGVTITNQRIWADAISQ